MKPSLLNCRPWFRVRQKQQIKMNHFGSEFEKFIQTVIGGIKVVDKKFLIRYLFMKNWINFHQNVQRLSFVRQFELPHRNPSWQSILSFKSEQWPFHSAHGFSFEQFKRSPAHTKIITWKDILIYLISITSCVKGIS